MSSRKELLNEVLEICIGHMIVTQNRDQKTICQALTIALVTTAATASKNSVAPPIHLIEEISCELLEVLNNAFDVNLMSTKAPEEAGTFDLRSRK